NVPENLYLKLNEIDNKIENLNKEKNELYNLIDIYSKDVSILSSKAAELDNLINKVETFKDELNSYKTYLEPLLNLKENIEKVPEFLNTINDLKEKELVTNESIKSLELATENLKENLTKIIENYETKINDILHKIDNLTNDYEIKLNDLIQIIDNYKDNIEKLNTKLDEFNSLIDNKIIDYFQNYQVKIDLSQSDKILEIETNLNNLYDIINNINSKLENLNKEINYENIGKLIEEKITEYVNNVQAEIDSAQTEKILQIDKKIETLNNQYINVQSLIDAIQSQKIFELEEKIANIKKDIDNVLLETQHLIENKIIEYVTNVQAQIDSAQTTYIQKIENELNSFKQEVYNIINNNKNEIFINLKEQFSEFLLNKIIELNNSLNSSLNESVLKSINEIKEFINNDIQQNITQNIESVINNKVENIFNEKINSIRNDLFNNLFNELLNNLNNQVSMDLETKVNQINSDLFTKISDLQSNLSSFLNENILKSINEIKEFSNTEVSNKIDSKLNEFYLNFKNELINVIESHKDHTQKLIDYIQDIKIEEINKKINSIENNIENKLQNVFNQLENKIKEEIENNLLSIVNNLNENIKKVQEVFIKREIEEKLEITQDLPYDINKLIDFMNKEDINSNILFLKPNNRPFLKIRNNFAAIGKVLLKNGDIFNFIKDLLTNKELELLKNNGIFEKFFERGSKKYKLYTYKTVDGYILNIRRIMDAPSLNEVFLPIIDINIMLNNIKDLVIFTGDLGSGKSYTLSTIINHINNYYVKKIAIISEKIEYNFIDKESIIIQFEYQNDRKLLDKILFNILYDDFDIIWISTNLIDHEIMNTLINLVSSRKTVILELNYPSLFEAIKILLDLYKNKEDYKYKLINFLNLGISQKLIYSSVLNNFVPLIEIVVLDDEIRKTLLENKYNEYLQYVYKVGESKAEIQNYNECLAYLVRNGKLDKEEAKKYFQNITIRT
ncbi:MAG: hypothetical protein ACPL1F_00550, partial [bacterium]